MMTILRHVRQRLAKVVVADLVRVVRRQAMDAERRVRPHARFRRPRVVAGDVVEHRLHVRIGVRHV